MNNKIQKILDGVMWYIIYTLPLILCIVMKTDEISLVLSNLGIDYNQTQLYTQITSFFDATSENFIGLELSYNIITYLMYFISCNFIHVFIDVLIYIPRLCHELLEKSK